MSKGLSNSVDMCLYSIGYNLSGKSIGSAFKVWLWRALLCCALPLTAFSAEPSATAASTADTIVIVVSENSDAYLQTAERLRVRFEYENPERARFIVMNIERLALKGAAELSGNQLIVTVGVRAAQMVNGFGLTIPVLHTLVPKSAYEQMLQTKPASTHQLSGVFIDQPVARQLELVRLVAPQVIKVGALLGADAQAASKALDLAARSHGLQMEIETISKPEELPASLKRVLARSDALLALPDAQVYNQSTLQTILLNAYRSNQPVFGFSAAQVKAGALAAVYTTPEQIGTQAAEILLKAGAGGKWVLPVPQSPRYFNVAVNREVGRSLGLAIDEDIVLQEKLKRSARNEL